MELSDLDFTAGTRDLELLRLARFAEILYFISKNREPLIIVKHSRPLIISPSSVCCDRFIFPVSSRISPGPQVAGVAIDGSAFRVRISNRLEKVTTSWT